MDIERCIYILVSTAILHLVYITPVFSHLCLSPALAITSAVLTHEEAASLLVWYTSNNMLNAKVSDRVFWAIPGSASATTVALSVNAMPSASTGSSLSSTSVPIVAGIAVGICIAALLVVIIVRRRHRRIKDQEDAAGTSIPKGKVSNISK